MSSVATIRSTALEGDLENLALPELIQFFHLQGRDGVLAVIGPDGGALAALWYQGRQVLHALAYDLAPRSCFRSRLKDSQHHHRHREAAAGGTLMS